MTDKTIKLNKLPEKILIIKPSSLGDIVHSLPFLNAVRETFPKSEIHWIVAKGLEGLLEGHPMINKLWIINKDDWKRMKSIKTTISELRLLFKSLRREKFDMTVDLQGLFRSGVLTTASGASVRVGFKEAREGSSIFYTHKVEGGKDIHAVDRYLKIAKALGCDITEPCFPLPLSFNSFKAVNDLSLSDKYAVMVPGARKPVNRWPAQRFGELAAMLPIKTLVVGGSSDAMLAEAAVKSSKGHAVSTAGKTNIKGLIEIMRGARFVVSNDTGPMHIAAALGIPVFAIFGPANPLRTGPYGIGHTVIRKDLECSPCYKRNCRDPKCMDMISVLEVAEIIRKNQPK